MANQKFLNRSLEIVKGGVKESVSPYFQNLSSLKNDADVVRQEVMHAGKSAMDTFNSMRRNTGSPAKKIRDWFYGAESGVMGFDMDDEFDSGFEIDSSDNSGEEKPRELDANSMRDIAMRQSGEAYKLASKQADLHIANTAEIVSAINSRSSEMIASINKVTEAIIGIDKKLDNIISINTANNNKLNQASNITDSFGNLTLGNLFNQAKENMGSNSGLFSLGKTLLGQITPENVLSTVLQMTLLNKSWKGLNDRSINDIGERLNDTIGAVVHNTLTNLANNDMLAGIFGDINLNARNKNYQKNVVNTYDTKPAVFDGMTRQSIIHIIPEYLKLIESHLSEDHVQKSIDSKGQLTTKKVNYFQNEVGKGLFTTSAIDYSTIYDITKQSKSLDKDISTRDISMVSQALTGQFVLLMYQKGLRVLNNESIQPLNPLCVIAVASTIRMLAENSGKNQDYWEPIVNNIVNSIANNYLKATDFARKVNQAYVRFDNNLTKFAQTSVHANQAGVVTDNIVDAAFADIYNKSFGPRPSATNPSPATTAQTPAKSDTKNDVIKHQFDVANSIITNTNRINPDQYMMGIFNILNRGINVFVTNGKGAKGNQKAPYPQYNIKTGPQSIATDTGSAANAIDDVAGVVNAIDDITTVTEIDENGNPVKKKAKWWDKNKSTRENFNNIKNNAKAIKNNTEQVLSAQIKQSMPDNVYKMLDNLGFIKDEEGNRQEGSVVDRAVKSEGFQKVKGFGSKVKAKFLDNKLDRFLGEKDESGERSGGWLEEKVDKAREKGEYAVNNFARKGYMAYGSMLSDKSLSEKYNNLGNIAQENLNNAKASGNKTDTAHAYEDKNRLEIINNAAQIAISNGSISSAEIQDIDRNINNIHDAKLKRDLRTTIIPMLRRNEVKGADVDPMKDKQSTAGKILRGFIKYGGMIFKPFINSVVAGIKAVAGILYGFLDVAINKFIKPGLGHINSGFQSVVAGLFGSKRPGYESEGIIKRTLMFIPRTIKVLNNVLLNIPKTLTKATAKMFLGLHHALVNGNATITTNIVNWFMKNWGKRVMSGEIFKTGAGYVKKAIGNTKVGQKVKSIVDKVNNSKAGQWVSEKTANWFKRDENKKGIGDLPIIGDFLKGFGSAFTTERQRIKKEKADALMKQQPTTPTEANVQAIGKETKGIGDTLIETLDVFKTWGQEVLSILNVMAPEEEEEDELPEIGGDDDGKEKENSSGDNGDGGDEEDSQASRGPSRWSRFKSKAKNVLFGDSEDETGEKVPLGQRLKGMGSRMVGAAKDGIKGAWGRVRENALDTGKILGGIASMLGGLLQVVLGIVTTLSGFKAIQELVMNTLKNSLEPLNKAFQMILKAIKPIMEQFGTVMTTVSECVVEIVSSLMDVINPILKDIVQPLLEAIEPVLKDALEAIVPIVDILNVLLQSIMIPLLGLIKYVVVPILNMVSDTLKIITGAIELVGGGIMSVLGGIVGILGKIANAIGFGKAGDKIATAGSSMAEKGDAMINSGLELIKEGGRGLMSDISSFSTAGIIKDVISAVTSDDEEEEETKPVKQPEEVKLNGSVMDGTYASGDVITTNNYYGNTNTISGDTITNTYGSGNSQRSMGGYLNMDNRGCGPVALAEMINMRNGSNLSARNVASYMNKTGAYEPNAGTSVGSYITTANKLGTNIRPGRVTSQSLRMASPSNPITVVGSGVSYGTRNGNNHYMNVVGTDRYGNAYVSNPLTGRVTRKPLSQVASGSVVGLYGSGDEYSIPNGLFGLNGSGDEDKPAWTFSDAVQNAMSYLKNLAKNFLNAFTGPSSSDLVDNELNKISDEAAINEAKKHISDEDYAMYEAEAIEAANAEYERKFPRVDGENAAIYEQKRDKWVKNNLSTFLAATDLYHKAEEMTGNTMQNLINGADQMSVGLSEGISGVNIGISQATTSSGGGGGATKIIEVAKGYLGQRGTHFFQEFGVTTDWCAMFVSVCGKESGNGDRMPWSASCNDQIAWYKGKGRWIGKTNTPQPGYIIYFDWDNPNPESDPEYYNGKPVDHVGIVVRADANNVYTIEGNSGSTGDYTTSYVKENTYSLDDVDIEGYASPDYVEFADLPGNTNRDKIWNYLVAPEEGGGMGLSKDAAAGILANMHVESKFEPRREEGNYADPITNTSYNDAVDNGTYPLSSFANDRKGFGLVQWTPSSRKTGLWEHTKDQGISIGNIRGQLGFFRDEMNNSYSSMLQRMKNKNGSYNYMSAMEDFLRNYEVPADIPGNISTRGPIARDIYEYYRNTPIPDNLNQVSYSEFNAVGVGQTGSGTMVGNNMYIGSQGDYEHFMQNRPEIGDYVTVAGGAKYIYTDPYGTTKRVNFNSDLQKLSWKLDSINDDGTYNIISDGVHPYTKTIDSGYVKKRQLAVQGPQLPEGGMPTSSTTPKIESFGEFVDSSNVYSGKPTLPTNYKQQTNIPSQINGEDLANPYDIEGMRKQYSSLMGSGDIGDLSLNDFGYDSPNGYNNDIYYDGLTRNNVINRYNITRVDDSIKQEQINQILNHTFNVRSENIESLLTRIIDKIDSPQQTVSKKYNPVQNTKLFDERIPSQVQKLSIG